MKHRFQLYIVRMEILSTFHTQVKYISRHINAGLPKVTMIMSSLQAILHVLSVNIQPEAPPPPAGGGGQKFEIWCNLRPQKSLQKYQITYFSLKQRCCNHCTARGGAGSV